MEKVDAFVLMTIMSALLLTEMCKGFKTFFKGCPKDDLHFSKALTSNLIDIETDKSFEQCLKSCISRPRCRSVNYFKNFLVCELNSVANKSNLKQERGSVYTEIHHWMEDSARKCGDMERCNLNQKCVNKKCVISDCGSPPNVTNADYTASLGMGIYSKVEYKCQDGYRLQGRSRIGCQKNGEWSFSKQLPECIKVDCGDPPTVKNGVYSLLNGTTQYGSLAIYSCIERHICLPQIEMVKSTNRIVSCSNDEKWTKTGIQCVEKELPMESCRNASFELDMVYILDDTKSVSITGFQNQIEFFQTLTMRLRDFTHCIRVASFRHAKSAYLEFGFCEYNTLEDIRDAIGRIERNSNAGDYEVEAVEVSLNQFYDPSASTPNQTRFIIYFSDYKNADWKDKGKSVLQKAADINVTVIGLHEERELSAQTLNHHTIQLPSFYRLSEEKFVENCLSLIRGVFFSK